MVDAVVSLAVDSGFFCMAGPLRVFVSRFMMPEDIDEFQNENHTWVSFFGLLISVMEV